MTSTRDQIARRTRALLACAALASLGFGGDFVGCGGPPPPPGPVPAGERPECVADEDCTALMCTSAACSAGRCVYVEVLVDADGDGEGALPCGNDCDDRNAARATTRAELCDLIDNDCDERVDEGAMAAFVVSELSTTTLDAAPVVAGGTPGFLFVSNFAGGALEVRWVATNSGMLALANIESANVAVARARSLGDARAEIVWATTSDPVLLRRAVLRVEAEPRATVLIENMETLATLTAPVRDLRLEGDELGFAVLADAGETFLILPGLAPRMIATPTVFDLAVVQGMVAIPDAADIVTFYDRTSAAPRGTYEGSPWTAGDALIPWGERLFVWNAPMLTEIDPLTRQVLQSVRLDTDITAAFGATPDELVYVDTSLRVRGLDAMLRERAHASLAFLGEQTRVYGLGSRIAVVSFGVGNTTFQVEQCGD